MPLHRFDHPNVIAAVAELEKNGETVTAISSDDFGLYIATVKTAKTRSGQVETR